MLDAQDQRLLDALLDSWDRNYTILLNLLRALPEGGLEARGLVFRRSKQECAHNRNEINAFGAELVFREVPGELVQRSRDAEGFGV